MQNLKFVIPGLLALALVSPASAGTFGDVVGGIASYKLAHKYGKHQHYNNNYYRAKKPYRYGYGYQRPYYNKYGYRQSPSYYNRNRQGSYAYQKSYNRGYSPYTGYSRY